MTPDPMRYVSQTRKRTTSNRRAAEVTFSGSVAFGFQVIAECPITRLKGPGSLGPYIGDYPSEQAVHKAETEALAALDYIIEETQP